MYSNFELITMNNSSDAFKSLQIQLLKWVENWGAVGGSIQGSMNMSDLVSLLQVLGFQIRHSDNCLPEDTTPLRNNEKGIRIIVSCNHSGHRYFLEKPLASEMCKCITDSNEDESMQQSTAVIKPLNIVNPLPTELQQIIQSVTSCLMRMMYSLDESKNSSDSSKNDVVTRASMSSVENFSRIPPIIVSTSIENINSPTRKEKSRSLDTLTTMDSNSICQDAANLAYGISDLSAENDVDDTVFSIDANVKALSILKDCIKHFKCAISLMETDVRLDIERPVIKTVPTTNKYGPQSQLPTRSISSPNLPRHNRDQPQMKLKLPPVVQKTNSSVSVKNISRGQSSSKIRRIKSTSGTGTDSGREKLKIPLQSDLQGPRTHELLTKRYSNLYAHVKSTIPKCSFSKK